MNSQPNDEPTLPLREPNVLVVKIGGRFDPAPVLDDVAGLAAEGAAVVVVHGGGAEVDRIATELGAPVRTIASPDGTTSRRTDDTALDALTLALLGRVKPRLVRGLLARGVDAVGLSGADGGLLTATRRPAIRSVENGRVTLIRDDHSGRVTQVRRSLLDTLLEEGTVPVVSPPAATADGALLNVDADRAAAEVALALDAQALILLSDVPGVLGVPNDPGSVLPVVAGPDDAPSATGRMRHKVRAGIHAAAHVPQVIIGSGAVANPIRAALGGGGTVLRTEEEHS